VFHLPGFGGFSVVFSDEGWMELGAYLPFSIEASQCHVFRYVCNGGDFNSQV